jgi:hypothetical protein
VAAHGDKRLASSSGYFTPSEKAPILTTYVSPRSDLDAVMADKPCPRRETNPGRPTCHSSNRFPVRGAPRSISPKQQVFCLALWWFYCSFVHLIKKGNLSALRNRRTGTGNHKSIPVSGTGSLGKQDGAQDFVKKSLGNNHSGNGDADARRWYKNDLRETGKWLRKALTLPLLHIRVTLTTAQLHD